MQHIKKKRNTAVKTQLHDALSAQQLNYTINDHRPLQSFQGI
jgi:hypothetical protein